MLIIFMYVQTTSSQGHYLTKKIKEMQKSQGGC